MVKEQSYVIVTEGPQQGIFGTVKRISYNCIAIIELDNGGTEMVPVRSTRPCEGITQISMDDVDKILNSNTNPNEQNGHRPLGNFFAYDSHNNNYVSIFNEDGHAWTETFYSLSECIDYLRGI